ncbi:MAG: amidohydrolase family protein, partial [Candidatus Thermoplasmatota archaeon]
MLVKGLIYRGDCFENGYIRFEDGIIKEIGKICPADEVLGKGIIIPHLINAHVHTGDFFLRERIKGRKWSVATLVSPKGYKHNALRKASKEKIVNSISSSIKKIFFSGTTIFSDFRENGIEGLEQFNEGMKKASLPIKPIILSRTKKQNYDYAELKKLLELSNGIGISSINDCDYDELLKISKEVRSKKKLFALHASEDKREDINEILDLKPSFLVHMAKANESDLEIVRDANVPVVVCPSSNKFFGIKTPLKKMIEKNVKLALGTDNAMLSSLSIFEEMVHAYKFLSPIEVLKIVTKEPGKILNLNETISLQEG